VSQTGQQAGNNPPMASCNIPVSTSQGVVGAVSGDYALTANQFVGSGTTQYLIAGDVRVSSAFNAPVPNYKWSAIAYTANTQYLKTSGPMRTGFVQFDITSITNTNPQNVVISDGVHTYTYNRLVGTTTLPFDLGTLFHVSLGTIASISGTGFVPSDVDLADAQITFSLLEANGTTAVPLSLASVPEPAAWQLLSIGFCCFVALRSRRSRSLSKPRG
jgi:hypothetical protein